MPSGLVPLLLTTYFPICSSCPGTTEQSNASHIAPSVALHSIFHTRLWLSTSWLWELQGPRIWIWFKLKFSLKDLHSSSHPDTVPLRSPNLQNQGSTSELWPNRFSSVISADTRRSFWEIGMYCWSTPSEACSLINASWAWLYLRTSWLIFNTIHQISCLDLVSPWTEVELLKFMR